VSVPAADQVVEMHSTSELFDAVALLCVKYGARIGFNAEFPPGAQAEFEKMFRVRGVRMHVQKSPGRSVMVCEGPLS
jgi:hypothetical protein